MNSKDEFVPDRKPPQFVAWKLRAWRSLFSMWNNIHYTLGVSGTIAATAAAAQPAALQQYQSALAWFSALCVGLIAVLAPAKKARGFGKAWRHLDHACNKYRVAVVANADDLVEAIRCGEEFIDGVPLTDDKV